MPIHYKTESFNMEPKIQTVFMDVSILVAIYSGIVGGGLILLSLYLDSLTGIYIGMVIAVFIKMAAHIIHLSVPSKFGGVLNNLKNAWVSRGALAIGVIFISSLLHIGTYWVNELVVFRPITIVILSIAAITLIIYNGIYLSNAKGIPFWCTSILVLLFFVLGILGGLSILNIIVVTEELRYYITLTGWILPILDVTILALLVTYLFYMYNRDEITRMSVDIFMKRNRILFILIIILIIISVGIRFYNVFVTPSLLLVTIPGTLELISIYFILYNILASGLVEPPVTVWRWW